MTSKRNTAKAITLGLALTIAATLMTSLPVVAQDQWYVFPIQTRAYMFLSPNPIGVGQLGLIQAWISPRPMWAFTYYYNYKFTFTKPNGQIDTVTIPRTEQTGSTWFNYVPDVVGTWTVQFTWDGSDTPTGPSGNHTSAATAKQVWVVQQNPVPSWPAAPLPTGPLTFPINPENREWYKLIGPWWQIEYNSSHAASNMFTQAPNTPHILWEIPQNGSMSGMIGGPYGAGKYYSGEPGYTGSIQIVMGERAYFSAGGFIHCIDARTGKLLWSTPGSGGGGQFMLSNLQAAIEVEAGFMGSTTTAVLRSIGDRLIKYDPWTGAVICNVTGIGSPSAIIGDYAVSDVWIGSERRLIKWSLLGSTDDVSSRILWDVPYPFTINLGIVWAGERDVVGGATSDYGGNSGCINFTTGATLWIKNFTNIETDMTYAMGYGKLFNTIIGQMMRARDAKTGDIVWTSDPLPYPWGNFWAYTLCLAYGNVYACSYAGVVCFDATTGETHWLYSSGNSMPYGETPYGTWPFYHGPLAADGKIYAGTGEWGELGTLVYRGQNLHCVDALTGDPIWKIMGIWDPTAIAEGTLFATNAYDGASYAFSKGTTLTEVSVSQPNTAAGESVWIKGRVTDQSPAQPGTPVVSKESMKAWMEYLHMQQPQPMNTTGVPVDLYACHSNGTAYKIATVTSDGQGYFKYKWTPQNEDQYYVTANFKGDDSYYSSWNLTSLAVGPAPAAPAAYPQPIAPIDYTPMFTGIIAAVAIVAILVVIDIALARRRK